ncbi:hypothetical protein E2562_025090 [Oryza meyeriana var. granulata]|uniref:Uncharacterized protein n=1 Tax=Oryza meyeriana var. granulata TaxID=110450 RepID=A0A6G1D7P1_9ORYZ|nr:hypothetical protein E2562_025090 [Oryza meyeriana var. granulata]
MDDRIAENWGLLTLKRWVSSLTTKDAAAMVLDEIRPYLASTGGGELEFVAGVMTVRVALS